MSNKLTAIIGDVHGCLRELNELLGLLPDNCDLVFAGDLVDRGPDSAKVVQLVRSLGARCVMGNHEHKHVRHQRRVKKGTAEKYQFQVILELAEQLSPEDIEWMDQLPPYVQLPGNVTVVHGGIPIEIESLLPIEEIPKSSKKVRGHYNMFWYLRFVDSVTKQDSHAYDLQNGDEIWCENYDGRFGHVYYGHQPYMQRQPERREHATGLDLACVFGGHLCAAIVDENGKEVQVITVKSYRDYACKK